MTLPVLRVKTGLVVAEGGELSTAAAAIPAAPKPGTVAGADALSRVFAERAADTVDPVVASRPPTQERATGYAKAVPRAAQAYKAADERLGGSLDQQMTVTPGARQATPSGVGGA